MENGGAKEGEGRYHDKSLDRYIFADIETFTRQQP